MHEALRTRVGAALPVWALWLVAVVGFTALGVATGLIWTDENATGMPGTVRDGLLWPLRSWDFAWYERLASGGYPEGIVRRQHAFFPLWPLLLSLGPPVVIGGVVMVVASAAAFLGVAALNPSGDARTTAIALACMPGSFALALLYPDALALACAVWACVLVANPRAGPVALGGAVVLGAATAAARPNGLLVAIPLAWLAYRHGRGVGPLAGRGRPARRGGGGARLPLVAHRRPAGVHARPGPLAARRAVGPRLGRARQPRERPLPDARRRCCSASA